MKARFAGRVAIVTGAAAGIGRATAGRLAAEGARVLVADLNRAGAEQAARELRTAGGEAVPQAVDVSAEADVEAMVARAVREWGRLDILHNNAAATAPAFLARDKLIADMDAAFLMRTLEVNLLGTVLGCKHAIPQMIRNGGGSIINMSSDLASGGTEGAPPAYAASKAGVEAITRYVAVQYGKRGIRCNALAPGVTLSGSVRENIPPPVLEIMRHGVYARFTGTPDDQAAVVAFLASDDARYLSGETICVGAAQARSMTTAALAAYAIQTGQLRDEPGLMSCLVDPAQRASRC